jgi:hypothetical protein
MSRTTRRSLPKIARRGAETPKRGGKQKPDSTAGTSAGGTLEEKTDGERARPAEEETKKKMKGTKETKEIPRSRVQTGGQP